MKHLFPLLSIALLLYACTPPAPSKSEPILEGHWVFPMRPIANGKISISTLMTLKDGQFLIEELGSGKILVEDTYNILDGKLYLAEQEQPYLEIVKRGAEWLQVVLPEADSLFISKVPAPSTKAASLKARIVGHSFSLYSSNVIDERQLYFEEEYVFFFGQDLMMPNKDFPSLSFHRMPYSLSFETEIPSIIIGDYQQSHYKTLPNGEKSMRNLIVGLLRAKDDKKLQIDLYFSYKKDAITLVPLQSTADHRQIFAGPWRLGSKKSFNFKPSGELLVNESGKKRTLSWELDDSGQLVIMTEATGEKRYAIKNFDRSSNRMGYEFRKGLFMDMIQLSAK